MKVAGFNKYSQLGEKSNNTNPYGIPTIDPPLDSNLKLSSIKSFSTYSNHTIFIKNDGTAYALGDNSDGRISNSIPKKTFKKPIEVVIKLQIISSLS